ncbi:structural protein [Xanthomonas phage XbC2]|nr:structural protein [Xanthomonas phage XbC2]
MANFEPQWDLIADTNTIQEGQTTYFRLRLKKSQSTSPNNTYVLADDQYLEFTYNIVGAGETLEERDFIVTVGESTSSLVPIGNAGTGSTSIQGTHVVKFNTNSYDLSTVSYIDAYYFKIECPQDGIWDGPESLTFNIDSINVITLLDGQVANTLPSGVLGTTSSTLNYNTTNEVWLTPGLTTHGSNLYTIGGVGYGAESRLFVQAFGRSQTISGNTNVFMPAYEVLTILDSEKPNTHITGSGTILVPDLSAGLIEEIPLLVKDSTGNLVNTGLKFNGNNGQILQTMLYDSDPIDAYIKIRVVSVKRFYNTEADAYYVGKRFRAYHTWVAPSDTSDFHEEPTSGHLYQLKDTTTYPYVVGEETFEGNSVISYDPNKWYDLGIYNESLGSGIINSTRIFRVILNDNTGSDLSFETDSNLGTIHVGEYFGHTVYPKIVASGSDLVTYEINESTSPNDIRKYGLDLSADGLMIGTAYALSSDFSANDDIKLEFDVVATGKNGKSLTQRFNITIVRGFGQNFISADIQPSLTMERTWFNTISTTAFSQAQYYRASDPRFGIRKIPRILLKENYVDTTKNWPGIKQTVTNIRNGIVNTTSGAPTPDGSFRLVLGNYKVRSALDNIGNVLYDVLYREVHPEGTQVSLSLNPLVYTDYSNSIISEIFGLRQNVYLVLGEDTVNLLTDPTDLNNRGIVVDAIGGLSDEMIDTVPRFMNHPYVEDNIQPEYFPGIVVAYLQPGQGESFFNTLIQNNEHGALLNYEFEVTGVEFSYYVQDNARYERENFTATLKVPNLFQ